MEHHQTGLSVYGTDGEEYYPDPHSGNVRSEPSTWFSEGLRLYLDTSEPELMTYLGDVRHPRRKDQAFAIYRGADTATIFGDSQRAIQDELVEGEGWTVVDEQSVTNPRYLYHAAVENARSNEQIHARPLSAYVDFDDELVERALKATNAGTTVEPIEVIAADFQVAAELVHSNRDIASRIHVYNNRQVRPPSDVDLAIKVEPGPKDVEIPEATQQLFDSLRDQLKSHQSRERSQATADAIAAHAEHNDDTEIVNKAVSEGLSSHYDSLEVIDSERRHQLEEDLEATRASLQQRDDEVEHLRTELESERQRADRLQRRLSVRQAGGSIRNAVSGLFGRGSSSPEKQGGVADGGEVATGSIGETYEERHSPERSASRKFAFGLVLGVVLIVAVVAALSMSGLLPFDVSSAIPGGAGGPAADGNGTEMDQSTLTTTADGSQSGGDATDSTDTGNQSASTRTAATGTNQSEGLAVGIASSDTENDLGEIARL